MRLIGAVVFGALLVHPWAVARAGCRHLTVGVLGEFKRPTAGTTQPFGAEIEKGARLGLEQPGAPEASVCLHMELIDIANSIANIPDIIREAARKKGIHHFLGLGNSDQALAAGEALRETHSVLFTPTASSELLVEGDRRTVLLFPKNGQIAGFLAAQARKRGVKSVSIIYGKNSVYSRDMAELFAQKFEKLGGRVVRTIPVRIGHFSLQSNLDDLRRDDYTHLFLPLYELDVAKILSILQESGIKKQYIGTDSWGTQSKVIKAIAAGITFDALLPSIYSPTLKTAENESFVAGYRARYGAEPSDLSAFSYDGIRLIRQFAIACPGLVDTGEKTEACLARTLPFQGVTGPIEARQGLALVRRLQSVRVWHD